MSYILATTAAVGVLLATMAAATSTFADRVGVYLRPAPSPEKQIKRSRRVDRAREAGLDWTALQLASRRGAAGVAGAVAGMLAAQGDLFIAGTGGSLPGLTVLGAAAGVLGFNMWLSTRKERRIDRLRRELPTVADALALYVLAGESIATALDSFAGSARGVASEELARVLRQHQGGLGLEEALNAAGKETAHPDAARLYTLLATAHQTGGRLADSLAELAVDYRAALARDLTAEGGRKALTTYGPILALMIPVALLFLMYPTLVGLRELSASP